LKVTRLRLLRILLVRIFRATRPGEFFETNTTSKRVIGGGFSLIELLAVLLIIGLSISFIGVNLGTNSQFQLRTVAKEFANNTALLAEEAVLSNQQWGVDIYRQYIEGVEQIGYRWLVRNDDGFWLEPNSEGGESEFLFPVGIALRLELDDVDREQDIETKKKIIDPTVSQLDIANENGVVDADRVQPELWLLSSGEMTAFKVVLFDEENPDTQVEIVGDELGRVVVGQQDNEFEE